MPFNLSKKLVITLAVIGGVIVLLFSLFGYVNGLQKQSVEREVRLSRQYESLKSELDSFLSKAREQAGVTKAQAAAFDKIMLDAVQGRYQNEQGQPSGAQPTGGALFSAIVEAYPDLKGINDSFNRILDTISEGRTAFNNGQQKLQDQLREYDQWRKSGIIRSKVVENITGVPTDNLVVRNNKTLKGEAAYEVMSQVIKSNLTAESFDSGKLESQDFFSE